MSRLTLVMLLLAACVMPMASFAEHSIGRAPFVTKPVNEPIVSMKDVLRGSEAFAVDAYPGYNLVHFPDIDVPGTWTIIASIGTHQFFSGDFLGNDFTQMYVLDYANNTLYRMDVSSGALTTIGSPSAGGMTWTGLSGTEDGIMYGCATDITNSRLYTINTTTGVATLVGAITNAPGIIDCAINSNGQMYGVDIVLDSLVSIDPVTGAGTVIGSLGFDANYAQGMEFDNSTGTLYLAAYNNNTGSGELRTANLETGMTTLIGAFPGGAEVDCLSIPTTGGPSSEGAIEFDSEYYLCDDTVQVWVGDSDLEATGTLIVNVASTSAPTGLPVTLTESATKPGEFEGSIAISSTPGMNELLVNEGDTLTGTYEDANYGGAGAMTVTTTAMVDCTGPVISGVTSTNTAETAEISWTTDELATCTVHYGLLIPPGMTESGTGYMTSHVINLEDLTPCMQYYFSVESTDKAGNTTIDDNGGNYYGFITYEQVVLLEETMDENPNWEISGGSWAWGQPTGSTGDPTSGFTGSNVYGYNLSGAYTNSMPAYHLTTASFDCTECEEAAFSFYRWLGVENNMWDQASVSISNDNGSTWTTLWANGSTTIQDTSWSLQEFDISSYVMGQSNVKLRWTLGPTDTSVTYCGWNIDDVVVKFERPCSSIPTFTPTIPVSPTSTPTQGITPTATPTLPPATPTPTATATEVPATYTPEPTVEPTEPPATSTPVYTTGVELEMPAHYFTEGDEVWLKAYITSGYAEDQENVPFVVVLDIGAGIYWFYPEWKQYPPDFGYEPITLHAHMREEKAVLPLFNWPAGAGSFEGAYFYGGLLNQEMTALDGDMSIWDFGWGM